MGLESGNKFEAKDELRTILSSEDRKTALQEWKEAYIAQRSELAEVQAAVIDRLREEPDTHKEELRAMFREAAERGHFSGDQMKLGEAALDILEERRTIIRAVREKYPNDRELYIAVFGHSPLGPVKITAEPFELDVFCSNRIDLTRAMYFDRDRLVVFQQILRQFFVGTTGGSTIPATPRLPELKHMIIVRRNAKVEDTDDIKSHEEQHMFTTILALAHLRTGVEGREEDTDSRKELLKGCIASINFALGDELLAQNKGGNDRAGMAVSKSNYLGRMIESEIEGLRSQLAELPANSTEPPSREDLEYVIGVLEGEEYTEKLLRQVAEANTAYHRMMKVGHWPEEEVAALFNVEPLAQWPKLLNRLVGDNWRAKRYEEELPEGES